MAPSHLSQQAYDRLQEELTERSGLICGGVCDVLRALSVPTRDLRDARYAFAEAADLRFLYTRRVRDALPPRQAGGGGFDDLIERRARRFRKRLDIAHHRLSTIDL